MLDFATRVLAAKGPCLFSVGQAGFIIKSSSGQLLGIDLYLSDCVERLEGHAGFKRLLPQILDSTDLDFDVIVCTHPHWDHFDVDSVPEFLRNGAKVFVSVDCEKLIRQLQLNYYGNQITYIKPGDSFECGDFKLLFVNCDHGTGAPDAVGVVVFVDDHVIYEVGDSCLRLDRASEIPYSLDVLIAPINGLFGNMDSKDVAILSKKLNPAITIPCHYGMFASHGGDLKSFYDTMTEQKLPFLLMKQGEQYKLD